jgi:hypothetical protein
MARVVCSRCGRGPSLSGVSLKEAKLLAIRHESMLHKYVSQRATVRAEN